MEDLLVTIVEALGELLVELLMAAATDGLARAVERRAVRTRRKNAALLRRLFLELRRLGPVSSGVVFALLGCGAGLFSLATFPRPVLGAHGFHGVSLLISPVLAGIGMSLIGGLVQRRGGRRARIETFRYGFLFALAMAIVRFALVTRP